MTCNIIFFKNNPSLCSVGIKCHMRMPLSFLLLWLFWIFGLQAGTLSTEPHQPELVLGFLNCSQEARV